MRDTESLRSTRRPPWGPGWLAQPSLPRIDWRAATIAALSSIAVHVAFIEVVLWQEGGRAPHVPASEGLGANLITADEEPTATLIFIEDPGIGKADDNPIERTASAGKVLQNLRLTIITPQPSFDIASDTTDSKDVRIPPMSAGDSG